MSERVTDTNLVPASVHSFHAVAFVENFSLKDLAKAYPDARRTPHHIWYRAQAGGDVYLYPSGAVVFCDVGQTGRECELQRLKQALPSLSNQVVSEELTVHERKGARPDMEASILVIDHITAERAEIVANTVAQSAAMEYYERIVEQMFTDTDKMVDRLEKSGTVAAVTRRLHRFIGAAIGTRNEVFSVLHLFDKPDAAWDDPDAEKIYEQLRLEFDLVDRHQALELKLRSVQEALELVIDIARDRRLVLLESSIVVLIVLEIAINLIGH